MLGLMYVGEKSLFDLLLGNMGQLCLLDVMSAKSGNRHIYVSGTLYQSMASKWGLDIARYHEGSWLVQYRSFPEIYYRPKMIFCRVWVSCIGSQCFKIIRMLIWKPSLSKYIFLKAQVVQWPSVIMYIRKVWLKYQHVCPSHPRPCMYIN